MLNSWRPLAAHIVKENLLAEIQSLARGLKILDLLAASQDGLGITGLADHLDVDKGSASRLVQTLAKYGYAEKDKSTQRYHLGPHVVKLSQRLLARMSFRDEGKPFLRDLVDRTNECAHLAILARGQAFYIDQVQSLATLRANADIGTLAPLHCTALGKVLLTFGNVPMPTELETHTPRTISEVQQLVSHLERVRRQGYALDDEEFTVGVRCAAAPVYNLNGALAGAIGISGPANRMTLEQLPGLAAEVVTVAQAFSDHLNFNRL
jgi:IclR family acetate operon transcriptional repressor